MQTCVLRAYGKDFTNNNKYLLRKISVQHFEK